MEDNAISPLTNTYLLKMFLFSITLENIDLFPFFLESIKLKSCIHPALENVNNSNTKVSLLGNV